eukprot:g1768.t1
MKSKNEQVKDLFSQRRNRTPPIATKMIAGALTGVVTKSSTAPLERVKILIQTQSMARSASSPVGGVLPMLRRVVRQDGALALWRGNGANCIRVVPVYALKFTMNDVFRDLVRDQPDQKDEELSTAQLMACGTLAGLFQQGMTFPFEFVRTRLSLQMGSQKYYNGFWDCIAKTIRQEGPLSLYKGLAPTLIAGAPYVGLQMTFFTRWKSLIGGVVHDENKTITKLSSGALAGLCAQMITYPGDTVRRRMIANGAEGRERVYSSTLDCGRKIIRLEGIRGFYKGASANAMRCAPAAAIQFYCYDKFSSLLATPQRVRGSF